MKLAEETDSKRIEAVSLYRPKLAASAGGGGSGIGGNKKKKKHYQVRLYHLLFAAAYVYQVTWVVSTIGRPYREFLEKADREGFKVMEGTNKMRAELEHALSDINDPNRPADKMGWFDWMGMDIEEHAERKKREKERSVLDSLPKSMRVPGRHAPSFLPSLLLGILVTLNALVLLMQHWSVGFNVWLNYREVAAESVVLAEALVLARSPMRRPPCRCAAHGKAASRCARRGVGATSRRPAARSSHFALRAPRCHGSAPAAAAAACVYLCRCHYRGRN